MISRLTRDVDALDELLDGGLDELVAALLSVVSIGVILLVLDLPLALVDAALVPAAVCAVPLVPAALVRRVPAHPGGRSPR